MLWPWRSAEHAGEQERKLRLLAYFIALLLLVGIFLIWTSDLRTTLGLLALLVIPPLIWLPRRNRRIEVKTSVQVTCSSRSAYEFISNPNNWPLYVTGLELRRPVETPVRLGTIIPCRAKRVRQIPLEVDEEVVELEPERRFGTSVRGDPGSGVGTYTFEPRAGLTTIEYTYRALLTLSETLVGNGGLMRWLMLRQMRSNRSAILWRIKHLLEARGAPNV